MHEDEEPTAAEVLDLAVALMIFLPIVWVIEQWRKIYGKET